MEKRNQFLEADGLFFESETHEWFNDKSSTNYAQSDNGLHNDVLPNMVCMVTRDKVTGEYDRVVMDKVKNEIIYSTKSLEDLGFFIDKAKVMKRFN